jgi:hypothetical protein
MSRGKDDGIQRLFRALALAAVTAGPAAAEAPTPALVTELTAWVVEATGLPQPDAPPAVVLAGPVEMAALRPDADAGHAAQRIVALYDTRRRVIHLPAGWTGATAAETSILVHELVHHLQAAAGEPHACPAEREKVAYAAQARWLEAAGSDLATAFEIDALTLLVLTTCGM